MTAATQPSVPVLNQPLITHLGLTTPAGGGDKERGEGGRGCDIANGWRLNLGRYAKGSAVAGEVRPPMALACNLLSRVRQGAQG